MKTLFIIIALIFTSNIYTQDTTDINKRFENLRSNIDNAGIQLESAGSKFRSAWIGPVIGGLTSAVLLVATKDTPESGIRIVVWAPALIGSIYGIISFFSATNRLDEAGYYLRKSKKK